MVKTFVHISHFRRSSLSTELRGYASSSPQQLLLPRTRRRNILGLWEGVATARLAEGWRLCSESAGPGGPRGPGVLTQARVPPPPSSSGGRRGWGRQRWSASVLSRARWEKDGFWANINLLFWELSLFLLLFLEEVCILKISTSSLKFLCIFILFVPSNFVVVGEVGGGQRKSCYLLPAFLFQKS